MRKPQSVVRGTVPGGATGAVAAEGEDSIPREEEGIDERGGWGGEEVSLFAGVPVSDDRVLLRVILAGEDGVGGEAALAEETERSPGVRGRAAELSPVVVLSEWREGK